MQSIALQHSDVVVGVDTHKDEHVAVALDGVGRRLDEILIEATAAGYAEVLTWADELGPPAVFGVEGTGSYGSGLARFLRREGRNVIEVSRPPRRGERRLDGKSDPIDAEHAARAVLAGDATAIPKLADGVVESIRLLKIARDTAVKVHSQAMITLKTVIVTSPDELRAELKSLTDFRLMTTCAAFESAGHLSDPSAALRHVLSSLALRWLELHEEIKIHTPATSRTARRLLHRSWSLSSGSGSTSPPSCSYRRRQQRPGSLRSRLRQALWGMPNPSVFRKIQAPPAEPRREPTSQSRALPSRHRSDAVARTHDLLRGTTDHRRPHQERDHPLSQALRFTKCLQAAPSSLYPFRA